ncbi:hypothetical protein AFK18_004896 [Salmonella enterica subsp. enterica]|nr:hypothetical protein [Salmonella enterica subsp. enterica]
MSEPLLTASPRTGRQSAKTNNNPPGKPPRSRQINFTRLHSHAARCMACKVTLKSAPTP